MTNFVSDSDVEELQVLMRGWSPEPRVRLQPQRPDGLPVEEIARQLGLSTSAVKLTLQAALRKLRIRHPAARTWLLN